MIDIYMLMTTLEKGNNIKVPLKHIEDFLSACETADILWCTNEKATKDRMLQILTKDADSTRNFYILPENRLGKTYISWDDDTWGNQDRKYRPIHVEELFIGNEIREDQETFTNLIFTKGE